MIWFAAYLVVGAMVAGMTGPNDDTFWTIVLWPLVVAYAIGLTIRNYVHRS